MTRIRKTHRLSTILAAIAVLSTGLAGPASATLSGTISGTVFQDGNRNGVRDAGESAYQGHQLYLFDAAGVYVGTTTSDTSGTYAFSGLTEGNYVVEYAAPSWWPLRQGWVPTTTDSVVPRVSLHVAGTAIANFGWRPIVRSTTLGSPVAAYVGGNGLKVESYNDAVAPKSLYDTLMAGGLVGPEAPSVVVRLDYGSSSVTSTSVAQTNGQYSGYGAASYISWGDWLDIGEQTLFHEYGHAWSLYYAFMVQQDSTLSSYLQARGLAGDSRVDSTYGWSRREMIADDYRQLFGTPAARAPRHMNPDVPQATDVPGLSDFLVTSFRQAQGPPPPPPAALTVSSPVVTPAPVIKSATVTFSVSTSASVTLEIRDAAGSIVRTLLTNAAKGAGTINASWDRKDGGGRRVKSGTYIVAVRVVDSAGVTAAASTAFQVS